MEDLTVGQWSYIIGFLQGDGTLAGTPDGEGKMTVELSARDRDILDLLEQMLPFKVNRWERTRDTNFKSGHHSVVLYVCDMESRRILCERGIPYGSKSEIIEPPPGEYDRTDYLRGMIDADGSVGFTKRGFPFVSLGTSSRAIKDEFIAFIADVTGKVKTSTPNTAYGMYNISVFKEDAVAVAGALYYDGCMALERKRLAAEAIGGWTRPEGMRGPYRSKPWTKDQDELLLSHTNAEAAEMLDRTLASVSVRRSKLKRGLV